MIKFIQGDATEPVGPGRKVIAHVCNNFGSWGAGFSGAISAKWKDPEYEYRKLIKRFLGANTWCDVTDDIRIFNMIAQDGIGIKTGRIPLRYWALVSCLKNLRDYCLDRKASVHVPDMIGCGLAGGNRDAVIDILQESLCDNGVEVTAYQLDKESEWFFGESSIE